MTQEALKLALEALELAHPRFGIATEKHKQAITAIKEALREHALREVQRLGQEIEQEPVVGITAIRTWFKDGRVVTQTLCNSWVDTTPPQRKPLTDEQIEDAWRKVETGDFYDCVQPFARAIEAAHGIKENT
jgi:hypothetical protein